MINALGPLDFPEYLNSGSRITRADRPGKQAAASTEWDRAHCLADEGNRAGPPDELSQKMITERFRVPVRRRPQDRG
jgi:hypothetical protein